MFRQVFASLVAICLVGNACASDCSAYSLVATGLKNCGGSDPVLTVLPNSTIALASNCDVVSLTCVRTRGFSRAKAVYNFINDGRELFSGSVNLCSENTAGISQDNGFFSIFGLPQCPIPAGSFCNRDGLKINIAQYKELLGMLGGSFTLHADITTDKGDACIEVTVNFSKRTSG